MKDKFSQNIKKNKALRYVILYFLIITLFYSKSFSQNIDKDSVVIQKIIDSQKIKNQIPQIITVSDKKTVDLISIYIDKKINEKKNQKELFTQESNSKLGKRYLGGDKSTVSEIVSILDSKNKQKIDELLDELTLDFDKTEEGILFEDNIKQSLFKLIDDEDFEYLIIQFLGYNRVKDSQNVFEDRFLSGKSTDKDRLFYWLARNFKSEKAIDYLYNIYFKDNTFLNDKIWIINGFQEYFENGTLESKNKILEIGYDYIKNNPIKKNKLEKKSNDYLFSNINLNISFFGLLIKYGDNRNNEILSAIENEFINDINYSKIQKLIKFGKLKTLNELQKQELTLDLLTEKEIFFEVLETVKSDSYLCNNQNVLLNIIVKYESFNFNDNYELDRFISFFKGKDKNWFNKAIESEIKNPSIKKTLLQKFEIDNLSFDEINKFLFDNKIIDQLINQEQIDNYRKKEFALDDINSIYTCLEIAKISVNFDIEPNIIPVDYDELLSSFVFKSKNKIKDLKSFVQYKWSEKEEKGYYQVLVYFENKCFIMIPEDFGDWYDMETFENLLKKINDVSDINESFIPVNTGDQTAFYIFGEKEKIDILKKKFNLENEINEK